MKQYHIGHVGGTVNPPSVIWDEAPEALQFSAMHPQWQWLNFRLSNSFYAYKTIHHLFIKKKKVICTCHGA